MKEELKKYLKTNFQKEKKHFKGFSMKSIWNNKKVLYDEECEKSYAGSINNIDNFISQHKSQNNFQTLLFKYIDDKNLKDSDVYNKVHLDRRLFSKIRSSNDYHPSKETVLLLGISLELDEDEMEKLLESASYSLPKNNYYDLILRFCFVNKIYNLNTINDLLDEYHCKLFSV